MEIKDGLLGKIPFVTILVAIAMSLTFVASQLGGGDGDGQFEELLLRAQVFYERNPEVELNGRSRSLLGAEFVDRVQSEHAANHDKPVFSQRMRARTQAKFDAVVDDALTARMVEDPAWSEGITGPNVPATRYLTYALFHAGWLAFAVTLVFLLIAGLGLEGSWGALVQAPLVVVSIFVGGLVFAHVDAAGQMPLTGGGPLVTALLAAYLVRGIGGNLPLPGAILLPVWLFVDAIFVRGIWIENLGDWPLATLGVSMVLGASVAGTIRAMGIDAKLVDKVDSLVDGQHPALEAAERLQTLGRPADAYDTLAAAAADEPSNTELVLAWWEVAIEVGRADEVAHAILPILQSELRAGDVEAATTHWRQVMGSGAPVEVGTTLLVRMGEALLDAGEPEQALDSLRRALDAPGPMGSALAQRVVRIARDLDPVLTGRAAQVALQDPQIPLDARADLESLAAGGGAAPRWDAKSEAQPAAAAEAPAGAPGTQSRVSPAASQLDSIDADLGEPSPMAGAGAPDAGLGLGEDDGLGDAGDLDSLDDLDHGEIDLSHVGDLASPDDFSDLDSGAEGLSPMGMKESGGAPPVETDPNALSLQSIEREFASGLETDTPVGVADGDPESWNDPGRVEDLSGELDAAGPALMGEGDLDQPAVDNSFFEAGALSMDALSSEAEASDLGGDPTDPLTMPDELDGPSLLDDPPAFGQPPALGEPQSLVEPQALVVEPQSLSDSQTLPDPQVLGANSEPETPPTEPLLDPDLMAAKLEQVEQDRAAAAAAAVAADPPAPVAPAPESEAGRATAVEGLAPMATGGMSLRALKVLDAVPLALEDDAIKFDVEGRGKTRLPFERIDAVAVAAVAGLSAKPVLVIDFVMNWGGGPNDPLKVIRARSDGFNPMVLVGSGGSPLEAIKTLIRRVLDGAQATPLPDVGAVMGSPFSNQPDLASYEREVLEAG